MMMISRTGNASRRRRKSVTSDTLAAPMAFWRCHFPALCSLPKRTRWGGAHKKKGRLRCVATSGPSPSGRKRPWVGATPTYKTIAISGSIERKG
jgi:hypothetical protein